MAIQKIGAISNTPSTRVLSGGAAPDNTPFRVFVSSVNDSDQSSDVRISRYSYALSSPNILDKITIVGLDLKLNISYGDKIWLEILYDKNLTPVLGIINKGPKWLAQVLVPPSTTEKILVYPNELEFITKGDISNKLVDFDDTLNLIISYQDLAIAEIDYRKDVGLITAAEYDDYLESIMTQYALVIQSLTDYTNNLNTFFSAAPSATWKKLLRTYTLVAYTSHDDNIDLNGQDVAPLPAQQSVDQDIPQSSEAANYKIVQCLSSNLYLADMCYQNRYPCKLPMPYHVPVSYFVENGSVEEVVNTA